MRKHLVFFIIAGLITILILTMLIFSVLPKRAVNIAGDASPYLLPPLTAPTIQFGNPVRGAQKPKVTIVEFADYACAACASMNTTLQKVLADFPNVRLVWKDLPDPQKNAESLNAAIAARCAGEQNAFWLYHDMLFENQTSGFGTANYVLWATKLGLDTTQFSSCVDNDATRAIIEKDVEEAIRLRVDAAPYLFVNGQRFSGALDYEDLKTLITGTGALPQASLPKTP